MYFVGIHLGEVTLDRQEPTALVALRQKGRGKPVLVASLTVPEPRSKSVKLLDRFKEVLRREMGEATVAAEALGRYVDQVNAELVELVIEFQPGIVAIDAPLSLPDGRCGYGVRRCDLILGAEDDLRGVVPGGFAVDPSRVARAFRGLALRDLLDREGLIYQEDVIETVPPAVLRRLGLTDYPVAGDFPGPLGRYFVMADAERDDAGHDGDDHDDEGDDDFADEDLDARGIFSSQSATGDESIAAVAAVAAYLKYRGATKSLGDAEEGTIELP